MIDYLTINNILSILKVLLDVVIVSVLVFYCLKIVRNNSRTIQIFKGIILIVLADAVAKFLDLKTVEWITTQFINWGFLAIIIIFQPEIRNLLERIGKTTRFSSMNSLSESEKEILVNELVKTSTQLSQSRTGAIISIEQGQSLADYINTGNKIDSIVSSELLCSIFYEGTPLHDGAVIIVGNKVACASAYFPPTSKSFPSMYGARHRAAVGISEINDCITIVVSEETGRISIARSGELISLTSDGLKEYLMKNIMNKSKETSENNGYKLTPKPKNIEYANSQEIVEEDELIEAKEIVVKTHNGGNANE